jgi:hypothetical protein
MLRAYHGLNIRVVAMAIAMDELPYTNRTQKYLRS